MNDRIKQIWTQLESENYSERGLFKIRYSETSFCDVYLGIKSPEMYRMLILKVPFALGNVFNFRYQFRGLKFDKIYDPDDSNFILLNLLLTEKQFYEVFDPFIIDVLSSILIANDIRLILKNYTNRLSKWQSLFEKFNEQGLSSEKQKGLYGELFLLRKLISSFSLTGNIMKSWVGGDNLVVDFQYGNWGIEVKTSSSNNHQKVSISSERQLDTSNFHQLYLYHISLDIRQKSGETLIDIVDSIKDLIKQDSIVFNMFCFKLLEYGYFDSHFHLYENNGFQIRDEVFYLVENDFPRIEEKDVRKGIGDVRYSIILSYCESYSKSEKEVFKNLLFD